MSDRNQDPAPDVLFEAVLKPHRSLSPRGFGLLLMFIASTCFIGGLLFWSMGYWPIAVFFALDIVAIQFAFRMNYHSGRAMEIVTMTQQSLTVRRVAPDGRLQDFAFNPYWARFEVNRHPEWGVMRMALTSHGKALAIGDFLGPDDRDSFAKAFQEALKAARGMPEVHGVA
ncbi:DUF2244 domain-containing protein [Kaistia algarum]|uniref:DUF2244 domain-containing protein n=1 Tax=Kaistia algarum TaxID=2083279 RepID=UPI002253F240|nr:DUF2244 domain-containing protein [Kaistia algarum]MCX5513759.1 DUF2244 domain-containing protein [Kaistia algarum]